MKPKGLLIHHSVSTRDWSGSSWSLKAGQENIDNLLFVSSFHQSERCWTWRFHLVSLAIGRHLSSSFMHISILSGQHLIIAMLLTNANQVCKERGTGASEKHKREFSSRFLKRSSSETAAMLSFPAKICPHKSGAMCYTDGQIYACAQVYTHKHTWRSQI